mmetsp:Transcript_22947/g.40648  ORF Transcript_22947/g.40648 Transcript_22947/m.40648 type:complete len:496 (-) Transcript_22947:114-1601(-)
MSDSAPERGSPSETSDHKRQKLEGNDTPASDSATAEAQNSGEVLNLAWAKDAAQVEAAKEAFASSLPFPHWSMENVVEQSVLEDLQEEVMKLEFFPKENDLFSFLQTDELASRAEGCLKSVVDSLYSKTFRDLVSKVTGAPTLNAKIDLTSSVYTFTNNLLCHDDELSTRRVAYILYLVDDDWSVEDGGTLDLFTVDKDFQPNGMYKRIVPKRNTMIMFEVSKRSYHQVAQVLSDSKWRVSIGGWFHGPPAPIPEGWKPIAPSLEEVRVEAHFPSVFSAALTAPSFNEWINPAYLEAENQKMIQAQFEEESVAELYDFLSPEKLVGVNTFQEASWTPVGPYNKQRYDVLQSSGVLEELKAVLHSSEMLALVGKLTGLSVGHCAAICRRFGQGCYTLAYDRPEEEKAQHAEEVDWVWTMTSEEDDDAWAASEESPTGGQMVYLVDGEEEPLLLVEPKANKLTIAYRNDTATQSFVKVINARAPSPRFDVMVVGKAS